MAQQWNFKRDRGYWFGVIAVVLMATFPTTADAQIAGDGTLGTQVNDSLIAPCTVSCIITNGATRGSNLFHSFRQFSLPNGDFAGFVTTPTIQNVIVRVTGVGQPFISNINGTIATSNPANFFLLNPNGIIFGPGASLNIGGSFLATTANRIVFSDGTQFSTNDSSPLLTVNVPIGLQAGPKPGNIQMQESFLSAGQTDNFRDFALIGGDVTLESSTVRAPGRQVVLAGLGNNGAAVLALNQDRLGLNMVPGISQQDITLANSSTVSTRSITGGGEVRLMGRNIILDDSFITAGIAPGIGNAATNQAGAISISATNLLQLNQSLINNVVTPNAIGQGGNINITASDIQMNHGSVIGTVTAGDGNAGNIGVTANKIALLDNSQIGSQVYDTGTGQGGNIIIGTGSLTLTGGAVVAASTFGNGSAGNMQITANTIALDGITPDNQYVSGIRSAVFGTGVGRSGDIIVKTDSLTITNGANVSADTYGDGDAGNVQITANTIVLDGSTPDNQFVSGIRSDVSNLGNGHGGSVTVEAGSLTVTNGASVSGSTFGNGDAGDVRVIAKTITLDGTTPNSPFFGSGISSQVGSTGSGRGGNVTVEADYLTVTNGAVVSASTFGDGDAGNVQVVAKMIALDGIASNGQSTGGITSEVSGSRGRGGNISVKTGFLTVTNGAVVSTNTFGDGNAGSIQITANAIALDGISFNGRSSSAIASAVSETGKGRGGNIAVETGSLTITNRAAVSASTSGQGNAGSIFVTANTVDASRGGQIQTLSDSGSNAGAIVLNVNGRITLTDPNTGLFANTTGGQGGEIAVTTNQFHISNGASLNTTTTSDSPGGSIRVTAKSFDATNGGQLRTTTYGGGQAGNMFVNVTDNLTLLGQGTGLFAGTAKGSTGNGGNIVIDPRLLQLEQGATIAVDSQGRGTGGNIMIQAGRLELRDRGSITAETASTQGGNITLTANDLLLMRQNSSISATAGTAQAAGDGGNITIRAPFIVGVLNENSDITANAFTGRGGNITITTNAIFGLQFQPRLTPFSDITASSQLGINGAVAINTLNIDPNRGLVALPVNLTDPSRQISQDCTSSSRTSASSFVVTGRGGIPLSPDEPLEGQTVITQWVSLPEEVGEGKQVRGAGQKNQNLEFGTQNSLVEADRIKIGADGTIALVADQKVDEHPNGWIVPTCPTASAP